MFDAPPTNLPVEPAKQAAPPTPPPDVQVSARASSVPPPSAPAPQKGMGGVNVSGTKEPEDIFADIQEPAAAPITTTSAPMMAPPKRGFPWKILIAIGVPILVIGLGIGGYFLYQMYFVEEMPLVTVPQTTTTPTAVPITSEPSDNLPVDNPVPEPDEKQLAATQASIAMLQAQAQQQMMEEQAMNDQMMLMGVTGTEAMMGDEGVMMEEGGMVESGAVDVTTSGGEFAIGEEVTETAPSGIEPTSIVPPAMGADTDGDGLTNSEELLLGTNPNVVDSDGDSYEDGSELASGYDPAQPQARLDQSTALKTEVIGALQFIVPSTWTRSAGPGGSVRIQTGTPASFSVNQETFASTLSLLDWLVAQYPGSTAADYQSGSNVNAADVVYSKDKMTSWILFGNTVYSVRYATNGTGTKDFGALFDLMISRAQTAQ